MTKWKECKLGDILTFQRGHDLPKTKMSGKGYAVAGSNGIIGYHKEYTTEGPAITIGRSGNVGNPYIYYEPIWAHNTTLYIKEFKEANPEFIYYFLKTMDLGSYAGGSAVPTLNRNHIHTIPVRLPDINTQRNIANILRSFDAKIETNKCINRNLEEQCFTIFHKLFDEEIKEDLYVQFGEYANFKYGTMPKKNKIVDEGYPIFSGYKIVGRYTEKMFDEPQLIIVARGVGGTGDVKYSPANCYLTNLAIAIMVKDKDYEDYLYHYLMCQDMKILNTGSAQPQITVSSLEKYKLYFPQKHKAKKFSTIIRPFIEEMRRLQQENQELNLLGETLLPKLMSGELDVSDLDI